MMERDEAFGVERSLSGPSRGSLDVTKRYGALSRGGRAPESPAREGTTAATSLPSSSSSSSTSRGLHLQT